ncbi:MAG: acetate--CoA ligase family protein [Planctomycetota bacterium]
MLFVSPAMIDAHAVARTILERTKGSGKPVVACIMGRERNDEAVQLLSSGGVPVFAFPEEAATTLAGLLRYGELSSLPTGRTRTYDVDRAAVRRLLARARKAGTEWLQPAEARRLLELYGFPLVPSRVVDEPARAIEAAHALGFPVCLKAVSARLLHKSEHEAVRVGLQTGDEVYEAALDMRKRLGRRFQDLRFEVQAMAPGHRELLLGFTREPRFGPLLAVGLGGTHVEVLRDVAVRVGPLLDTDPAQMLDSLRAARLLGPFRNEPAIDRRLVEDCLLRLNQLALDCSEIAECDLNPFLAAAEGVPSYVVDARMRISSEPPAGRRR